jgi:hypothetical protein
MNIKAKIWWRIWQWWHYPSMMRHVAKEPILLDNYNRYRIYQLDHNWLRFLRLLAHDLYLGMGRVYWACRWYSQLRCSGNLGGWRTRFCDWIEDKARGNE